MGSGSLTRGRWGVEVGCKAVDVAADGDPLVGDPEGAEDGNRALGWRGRPRQGPRWGWERGGTQASGGCPLGPLKSVPASLLVSVPILSPHTARGAPAFLLQMKCFLFKSGINFAWAAL